MYPLIVCTCGYPLGDIYNLYRALLQDRMESSKMNRIGNEFRGICNTDDDKVGDILDDLGLRLECCRAKMISQVTFAEQRGDEVDARLKK